VPSLMSCVKVRTRTFDVRQWRHIADGRVPPLELAGANFLGIPWMQLVNLVLCAWPTLALAAGTLTIST